MSILITWEPDNTCDDRRIVIDHQYQPDQTTTIRIENGSAEAEIVIPTLELIALLEAAGLQ